MPIKLGDCWLSSKHMTVCPGHKSCAAYNQALKGASQKEVPLQGEFGTVPFHGPESDSLRQGSES